MQPVSLVTHCMFATMHSKGISGAEHRVTRSLFKKGHNGVRSEFISEGCLFWSQLRR
jgi:hypothetical protein